MQKESPKCKGHHYKPVGVLKAPFSTGAPGLPVASPEQQ